MSSDAQSGKTTITLQFAYVNSSSTRSLQQLLTLLDSSAREGARVEVRWLVEVDDDAMTELGIDLLSDKHSLSYQIVNSPATSVSDGWSPDRQRSITSPTNVE